MHDLQEIFDRILKTKKDYKEIRATYRDTLKNSLEYQESLEQIEKLRARKKQIEQGIKDDQANDFTKMETLALDIKTDTELLNDLSLNKLMAGEKVEITDAERNRYEPVFSVRFKKT